MGINLLINSTNRGLEIFLYMKKVRLYRPNFCTVFNQILYSTGTSTNFQLVKNCQFTRNLSSCDIAMLLVTFTIIITSEYVPFNIWIVMFYEAQGYDITKNVLFQDIESEIKMQNNGRDSCTWNSRHINIRHFFVKDKVDKEEIEVQFCPTYWMIADYFTKPLQRNLFKLFRDLIIGYKHIGDILADI